MLPAVIVDMITIVILAVAVLVISTLIFFFSVLVGFIVLLVGILIVGKVYACMYTHARAHTHAHTHTHPSIQKFIYFAFKTTMHKYNIQWNLDLSFPQRSFSRMYRSPFLVPKEVPYK